MKRFLYEKILTFLIIFLLIIIQNNKKPSYVNTVSLNNDLAVFMYHSFTDDPKKESKYVVHIDDFEKDILYLKKKGVTFLDSESLYSLVKNKKPLPKNSVMSP